MAKKPVIRSERMEMTYDDKRWYLLDVLRDKAAGIMSALAKSNILSIIHGSVARGDVFRRSDVDIFIPQNLSSFLIETALEKANMEIVRRTLVQATPTHSVKGHIELGDNVYVSFPLLRLRSVEQEFYRFGGEATLKMIVNGDRVKGVDKRLMLIEPTPHGHVEENIIGREEATAKILRISPRTVTDRVRALVRRDKIGRTGLFIERELYGEETFESVLKDLADENPAVRRRTKKQ